MIMEIKKKLSQHRRDFDALYVCEFCGFEKRGSGYDDHYFHSEVIPKMVCADCGKSSGAQSSKPDVPAGVVL